MSEELLEISDPSSMSLSELEAATPFTDQGTETPAEKPLEAAPAPVEQPATQPAAQTQSQAKEPLTPEAVQQAIEKRLEAFQRELGQTRALQGEFAKLKQQLTQTAQKPNETLQQQLAQVSPEQKEILNHLFEQYVNSKYGDVGAFMQQQREQAQLYQQEREASTYEATIRQLAGKDYANYEPIMVNLLNEGNAKVASLLQAGDEIGAKQAYEAIQSLKTNPEYMLLKAQTEYSKTLQAQASKVTQQQQQAAAKATTTLTTVAPKNTEVTEADIKKMSLKQLEELVPFEP